MKPSVQCAQAAKRANQVLGQILKMFHFRDKVTYIALYKRYVRCHLEFSGPVWSPWMTQDIEVLEKYKKEQFGQCLVCKDHMKIN